MWVHVPLDDTRIYQVSARIKIMIVIEILLAICVGGRKEQLTSSRDQTSS
jgi:hypothetical protein